MHFFIFWWMRRAIRLDLTVFLCGVRKLYIFPVIPSCWFFSPKVCYPLSFKKPSMANIINSCDFFILAWPTTTLFFTGLWQIMSVMVNMQYTSIGIRRSRVSKHGANIDAPSRNVMTVNDSSRHSSTAQRRNYLRILNTTNNL